MEREINVVRSVPRRRHLLSMWRIFKYSRYIAPTVLANWRVRAKWGKVAPFVPFIVTSRVEISCDRSARVVQESGSYIRLGYGSGGIATFPYTGIRLELFPRAVLRLCGVSLLGYGGSLCLYEDAELIIGDRTYIAGNATIKAARRVSIGSGCAISWNVTIMDSDFHPWTTAGVDVGITAETIIGNNVWIGNGATVLKGVNVGAGAIIAAGSVVTCDVSPNTLVGGNPARVLRKDVSWR